MVTLSTPEPITDAELKANALKAANGRSFSRRGIRLTGVWEWVKVFPAALVLFLVLRTFVVEAYKIPTGSMEQTLLVGDFLLVNKMVYGAAIPFSHARTPAVRVPRHGDVVVFEYPVDPTKNFVKRLVGLPGDTLAMHDGVLVRNGERQNESYVVRSEPGFDPIADEFRWQGSFLVGTAAAANSVVAMTDSSRAKLGTIAGAGIEVGRADSVTATIDEGIRRTPYRPSRNNWGPLVVPTGHIFVLGDNRDNSLDSRYWGFVADSLVRGTPLVVYYSFSPDSVAAAPWLTRIRWSRFGTVVR